MAPNMPGGAARVDEESGRASMVMARELQKIDSFLSGAATDLGHAGVNLAHHVGTPGKSPSLGARRWALNSRC